MNNWNGIFKDIPAAQYHERSLDVASSSGLKQMLRTPSHFRHWIENPDDEVETPAKAFGKALHCATLEPEVFERTYTVIPPDAPQRPTAAMLGAKSPSQSSLERQAWWANWEAENRGRILLSSADHDRARYMADSVRKHPVAAGLLVGGDREITFRWMDEETGLRCKSRADLFASGEFLLDLKSCVDASPEGFARTVNNYNYPTQQAHYCSGIRHCGDKIKHFIFLAVESSAPFVCQPYILDANAEQLGESRRSRAMRKQAECLASGDWPGYSQGVMELTLPAYAYFSEPDND